MSVSAVAPDVSIIIPVRNKLEFTRQCLDRIWRHTGGDVTFELIIVDNGSSDGTEEWFADCSRFPTPVIYQRNATNLGFSRGNNLGARLSKGRLLLFLNNDTLARPGWLSQMVRLSRDPSVGVVGIKQLFPYTNTIYHTGIVFNREGRPEHLYPHLDADLPQVNQEREYQAVTGACLMIDRALFDDCGGFDEGYVNGYEDIDLCLSVRERGRKVICCTSAFIYHYGQISEGRTADDDENAARFASRWSGRVKSDLDEYLIRDGTLRLSTAPARTTSRELPGDAVYLADDLEPGSALTWINAELALALQKTGVPVFVNRSALQERTLPDDTRRLLTSSAIDGTPTGGAQIKWSHYRTGHLNLELAGNLNLEFFVVNYLFGSPGSEPWDYWLQSVRGDPHEKLPLSEFCRSVLLQIGVAPESCHVWVPGYSREIETVEAPRRRDSRFRFLTVTNSHDLERYNTRAVIDAYRESFTGRDGVILTIKDYGASSGDTTIRRALAEATSGAPIEYVSEFTDKATLIGLYKSCDAFVSAHRGEGFGMKILDALACGLPVVTPLFGGPTAYCHERNCFPVAFSLVPMGDCLDTRALRITNQPIWAEVDRKDLGRQMQRLYADRSGSAAAGIEARDSVLKEFSWSRAAARLVEITREVSARRAARPRRQLQPTQAAPTERSPYWLGVRLSVVVPTHNRKDKLLASLDALSRQSILPNEFEVIVVDDGSTDGTKEALDGYRSPFVLRYFRQENAGPGAARNLGVAEAAGEFVLFIGDDIVADERLLEEHLLAHASQKGPGVAILGHIDWPDAMPRNAVMDYVCGDAALQFAYTLIPRLPSLDHRFFYTSNISLRRQFLVEAAEAGVRFDPAFRRAAFEDSELAFRLIPRGLRIVYHGEARVTHDHAMDLESFARREFGAGEMAVVFYRKHPGQDEQLLVRSVADLVEPAAALAAQPDLLGRLESFDARSDALLRALAGSLEDLIAIDKQHRAAAPSALPTNKSQPALDNVLRVIFDVERTRGKVEEWFRGVNDPGKVRAARILATVRRKIDFLNLESPPVPVLHEMLPGLGGLPATGRSSSHSLPGWRRTSARLRRLVATPAVFTRLASVDRFIEGRLQSADRAGWLARYRRVRRRIRAALT